MSARVHSRRGASALVAVGIATAIAMAGCIVFGVVAAFNPAIPAAVSDLTKTLLQVVGVAFLGACASLLTTQFQNRHAELAAEDELRREARRHTEEALRTLLTEAIDNYHRVKRARRTLRAKTGPVDRGVLDIASYDECMSVLMDVQLELEQWKRFTKSLPAYQQVVVSASRPDGRPSTLADEFATAERFLNEVLDEYAASWRSVRDASTGLPLSRFPVLCAFFDSASFRPGAAIPLSRIQHAVAASLTMTADDIDSAESGRAGR
ncbi:MAG: hypothetical protein QM619_02045 [Micropruina sp.]|uniref:hypothetical protein n=1 Tax=Micropruina sp. TaxID=2737536 RepID=UPI0039E46A33